MKSLLPNLDLYDVNQRSASCIFANLENCCIFAGAYLQGRVKFPIGGKSPRAEVSGRKAGTEAGTVGTTVPTVRSGRIFSRLAICRRLSQI